MASMTYYVAMPFIRVDGGDLVAGEPQECQTAISAERRARSLSATHAGAVAFARTGDPGSGDFQPAELLASFGEVPSLEELMGYE